MRFCPAHREQPQNLLRNHPKSIWENPEGPCSPLQALLPFTFIHFFHPQECQAVQTQRAHFGQSHGNQPKPAKLLCLPHEQLNPKSAASLQPALAFPTGGEPRRGIPRVFVFIFVGLMLSCGCRSSGIDAAFAPIPQILNKQPFFKQAGPGEISRKDLSLLAEQCLLALTWKLQVLGSLILPGMVLAKGMG